MDAIHPDATLVRAQTSVLFGVLTRHLALHMLRSRNIPATPRGTVTSVPILLRGNPGNQRSVPCPGHRPQGPTLALGSLPTQRDLGSRGGGLFIKFWARSVSPWRQGQAAEVDRGSAGCIRWPEEEPLGGEGWASLPAPHSSTTLEPSPTVGRGRNPMATTGGPSAQCDHYPRASLGHLPTSYLLWGLGASGRAMGAAGWEGVRRGYTLGKAKNTPKLP